MSKYSKNLKINKWFAKRFIQTALLNFDSGLKGVSWKKLIGTKNDIDTLLENPQFIEEIEYIIEKIIFSEDKSMETTLKNRFKLKYYDEILNDEMRDILTLRVNDGLKGVLLKSELPKYHQHPLKEYDINV